MVNGAFMVLKGHRSIVNQVRFNPHTYMICSSGVEKVIKVRRCLVSSCQSWVSECDSVLAPLIRPLLLSVVPSTIRTRCQL